LKILKKIKKIFWKNKKKRKPPLPSRKKYRRSRSRRVSAGKQNFRKISGHERE
jgi:hypothetical protein